MDAIDLRTRPGGRPTASGEPLAGCAMMPSAMASRPESSPFRHAGDAAADRRRQWFGVIMGMGWLAIPVVTTATEGLHAWKLAFAAVVFGLAGATYLRAVGHDVGQQARARVLRAIGVVAACGIALTLVVDPSWAILFTYAGVIGGLHLPTRLGGPVLAGIVALAIGINLHEGIEIAFSWGVSALGIGALMLALGRLIAANAELRAAHAEIGRLAIEAERERFARDLHDVLGHSLSVIALKAELAGRLLPDRTAEARRHVAELEAVARAALGEVRETVSGYRRPTLAGELAGARLALEAAGVELRVRDGAGAPEDPEPEAVLAWAVREGTTNVIRHSGARRCEIAVEDASVEVRDDGRGVDPAAAPGDGNGLDGLRERATALGGAVEAGPLDGGGFRLRVSVPADGARA